MKKLFVILTALALVWAFAAPAAALDWNFYGSARMTTFYTSDDYGDFDLNGNATKAVPPIFPVASTDDDDDDGTEWVLKNNSRVGATVKGENVGGRFEMGLTQDSDGSSADSVRFRRVFGTWNFGAGTLKVGKDYTPVSQFMSTQAFGTDLGLLGWGAYYGGRRGQLALSMGGFTVALIQKSTGDIATPTGVVGSTLIPGTATGNDSDAYFPKVEASWGMAFDNFNFSLMGGFQTYELEDQGTASAGTDDIDVTSWVIGGMASFSFGPAYIKGAVSYDQNGGNAGWTGLAGTANTALDDIDDANTLNGAIAVGFKMSDMVSFEVGAGAVNQDWEAQGFDDITRYAVYGNATIALAPGVYIIPEAGYFNFEETNLSTGPSTANQYDTGNQFYLGAKWQIDF